MTHSAHALFGYDWQVIGYEHVSGVQPCGVCGKGICRRFHVTKEGHGIKTIGPECVKHVTAPSGLRFAEIVETVAKTHEANWERPYKVEQLDAAYTNWYNSAAIPMRDTSAVRYQISRAVADNRNPDTLLRNMRKASPDWSFAWRVWTDEEVAERNAYVTKRVQEWIDAHKR